MIRIIAATTVTIRIKLCTGLFSPVFNVRKLVSSMPSGNWIYEIKFDGYRALALRGGGESRILSRNQNDLGKKFTNIRDSIAALDVEDAII